ncbi:MAG: TonB-dependent receptor domain-containing protein, partial [Gemmatimonadaceae bacterium]
ARFPALRELYSGSLGRFEPNPSLDPETLVGAEAGATIVRSSFQLQGVAFHHRLSDAIVRTTTEEGKFRRVNRDQIRSTGVELLAGWSSERGLTVSGDLLLQRVRVADPAVTDADRRPEHQPEVRASVDVATPLPFGVRGGAGVRVTGKQYCVNPDLGRQEALARQTRGDVSLEREWRIGRGETARALDRVKVALSLDNVTDAAVYDQCGLPQPGRTLRLVVSWR